MGAAVDEDVGRRDGLDIHALNVWGRLDVLADEELGISPRDEREEEEGIGIGGELGEVSREEDDMGIVGDDGLDVPDDGVGIGGDEASADEDDVRDEVLVAQPCESVALVSVGVDKPCERFLILLMPCENVVVDSVGLVVHCVSAEYCDEVVVERVVERHLGVESVLGDAAAERASGLSDVEVTDGEMLVELDVGEVEAFVERLFGTPDYERGLDFVVGVDILHLFGRDETWDEADDASGHILHIEGDGLLAESYANVSDGVGDADEEIAADEEWFTAGLVCDMDIGTSYFAEEDSDREPFFASSVVAESRVSLSFFIWHLVLFFENLEGLGHLPDPHNGVIVCNLFYEWHYGSSS